MITVFTGPEGAGKTLAMTRACLEHVKNGGVLYTFPGYRIHDKEKNVLSKEITVGDFLEMVLSGNFNNVMLAIDEMQNWFDSYAYNAQLSNIFVAVEAQRRKINLKLVGTVQDFTWLPPRMRRLTHFTAICNDFYYLTHHRTPKGRKIYIRYCDLKGFITGKPGTWLHPVIITNAKLYWDYYDTYAVVDFLEKFTKVKINKRVIEVDVNGDGVPDGEFTPNPNGVYIPSNGNGHDQTAVQYVLNEYVKNGVKEINVNDMYEGVAHQGVHIPKVKLGAIMRQLGWVGKNLSRNGLTTRYYIPIT